MPFGCFKKEKDPSKKSKKSKKAAKEHAEDAHEEQNNTANTVAPVANDSVTKESHAGSGANGHSASKKRSSSDSSSSYEDLSAAKPNANGKLDDPRSPRAETTPRAADGTAVAADGVTDSTATTTNREALISSDSSHPGRDHSPSNSTATPSIPPKPASLLTRSGSQIKSSSPMTPRSVRLDVNQENASVVPPLTGLGEPVSPRRAAGSASSSRRGSLGSRGRTSSISNNDMNRIYRETDEEVASARARIMERKMTLRNDLADAVQKMESDKAYANRASVLLGIEALDGLDLDAVEADISTFREEEYREDVLEERLLNEKVQKQLETDVKDTKAKIDAMKDDSDSLDLDDLNSLEDKLDDLEDGSGSDDEEPSYKSPPMSPMSFRDDAVTADTATNPEGESVTMSANATPRHGAQDVEPVA